MLLVRVVDIVVASYFGVVDALALHLVVLYHIVIADVAVRVAFATVADVIMHRLGASCSRWQHYCTNDATLSYSVVGQRGAPKFAEAQARLGWDVKGHVAGFLGRLTCCRLLWSSHMRFGQTFCILLHPLAFSHPQISPYLPPYSWGCMHIPMTASSH